MIWLLLGALACTTGTDTDPADDTSSADADTDSDTDTDTDADSDGPSSDAAGSIDLRDGTQSGQVAITRAFSFATAKKTFIYASSNPDASCATLTELYDPKADPVDMSSLFLDNYCNLSVTVVGAPPVQDYSIKDGDGSVIVGVSCPYGEGSWEYSGGNDSGYFWTGPFFSASAFKESVSVDWLDQGDATLHATVKLGGYKGTLSTQTGEVQADGWVKGEIYTTECAGLSNAGGF